MYIDKIIKKEVVTLLISVGLLLIVFIGVSFASFFKIDEGKDNVVETGDLAISFCSDSTCDTTYENIGQVIGTTKQDGASVPSSIYPYPDGGTYSNATPYIFKVTNTGSMKATITIKLKEDNDFLPSGNYSEYSRLTDLYAKHLKVAIRKKVLLDGTEYQLGDVNMDGIVNSLDATKIEEIINGSITPDDTQKILADVNDDGSITSRDIIFLSAILIGQDYLGYFGQNVVVANGLNYAIEHNPERYNLTTIYPFSELDNSIIYTGDIIEPGESATYFLWLYLDEKTPNQAQKTYFVGNLDIQGEFIPDGAGEKTDCTILAGTGKNIGDEVQCGTEEFYIYSNDGTTIKMLAKNVLMVGNNANKNEGSYGLQSKETSNTTSYTVAFDSGTNSYEKSDIKVYVDNYKERLLRRYNLSSSIDATLITKDELVELGCSEDEDTSNTGWYRCIKSNYSWTYSTMYWTKTESDVQFAYAVKNGLYVGDGILASADGDWNYYKTIDIAFGVRPVIIVPATDIIK